MQLICSLPLILVLVRCIGNRTRGCREGGRIVAICFVLLSGYRVTIGLVLLASSLKTALAAREEAESGRHGL